MQDRSILSIDEAETVLSRDEILRKVLAIIVMANMLSPRQSRRDKCIAHFVTVAHVLTTEDKNKLLSVYTELQKLSLLNEPVHLAILSDIQKINLLFNFMQTEVFVKIINEDTSYNLLTLPVFITHVIYKQREEFEELWATLSCFLSLGMLLRDQDVEDICLAPWIGKAYRICEKHNYLDIDKKELMAIRIEMLSMLQVNQSLANAITTVNDFHLECERFGIDLSEANKKKDFKSLLHAVYEENGVALNGGWCRCFHEHKTLVDLVKLYQAQYDINPVRYLG